MLAWFADQRLLLPADTVHHAPGMCSVHDTDNALIGPDLDPDLDARPDRDHPVQRRISREPATQPFVKVLLDKGSQLGVDCLQLVLVEAYRKGHQPIGQTRFGLADRDQPALCHLFEQLAQCLGIGADPSRNLVGRFRRQTQLSSQRSLLGCKEVSQDAQFDAALGRRIAFWELVQAPGQLFVRLVLHLCLLVGDAARIPHIAWRVNIKSGRT